jgi:peptide/nickel transport system substrate-binding protein
MNSQPIPVSRRAALRFLSAVTGTALVAACAPSVAPGPTIPPAAAPVATAVTEVATAAAAQAKRGGILRIDAVGDVANLDGHSWGPKNGFSIFMIFDTLTNYDQNLKPQPELAESWDYSSDFKQMKVTLRRGVLFHTGREMTSADIVYNLQRPLDPKLQATIPSFTILPGFVPPNTVFEAPDKSTFTIKTERSWPAVFDYFQVLNILDRETADGPDGKSKARHALPLRRLLAKRYRLQLLCPDDLSFGGHRSATNEPVAIQRYRRPGLRHPKP